MKHLMEKAFNAMNAEKYQVCIDSVKKDGRQLTGISLKKEASEKPVIEVRPILYMEDAHKDYLSGRSMKVMAIDMSINLYSFYHDGKETDFEIFRKNLIPAVVNKQCIEEDIKKIPHREIADLILYYRVESPSVKGVVDYDMAASYMELSETDLYEMASSNFEPDIMNKDFMHCVFNHKRPYGASAIAFPWVLKYLAEVMGIEDKIHILPSSIHELILIDEKIIGGFEEKSIQIIREANDILDSKEVLSYNLYEYSVKEDCVRVIKLTDPEKKVS